MLAFRNGKIHHLVTTDVASRGIDIEDLSHVFIFSTPDSPEQYIHRAGRTGRVGKSGRAISLVSAHDLMNFNRLVRRYHIEVQELQVPSDDEVRARKAQRIVDDIAVDASDAAARDLLRAVGGRAPAGGARGPRPGGRAAAREIPGGERAAARTGRAGRRGAALSRGRPGGRTAPALRRRWRRQQPAPRARPLAAVVPTSALRRRGSSP